VHIYDELAISSVFRVSPPESLHRTELRLRDFTGKVASDPERNGLLNCQRIIARRSNTVPRGTASHYDVFNGQVENNAIESCFAKFTESDYVLCARTSLALS
jgi:hypothetical protein